MNAREIAIIEKAKSILEKNLKSANIVYSSSETAKTYLCLTFAKEWREVFAVCFLNRANQLITCKKLFFGTLASTEIHVRIIAKEALLLDATSVILCHNHPSGDLTASSADIVVTKKIQKALELFDIDVLDHVIVSGNQATSFAEEGLLAPS